MVKILIIKLLRFFAERTQCTPLHEQIVCRYHAVNIAPMPRICDAVDRYHCDVDGFLMVDGIGETF